MKDVITGISVTEDVTLVSLINVPGNTEFISDFFTEIAKNHINIDMITMSASQGAHVTVSFTAQDNSLTDILNVTGRFKTLSPKLRTDISSGNFKLSFYGEKMKDIPGIAASVFKLFTSSGIEIKLITTSEVDISCLFERVNFDLIMEILKSEYGNLV